MDHCCNMLCFFVNATIRIPEVPVPRPVTHLLAFLCACVCIAPYDAFLRFFLGILKLLGPLRAVEARDGGHGSGWNIDGVLSDSIEIQQFGLAAPQSDSAWVTAGRLNPAPGSRVRLSP